MRVLLATLLLTGAFVVGGCAADGSSAKSEPCATCAAGEHCAACEAKKQKKSDCATCAAGEPCAACAAKKKG